jgi:hypothetical protein
MSNTNYSLADIVSLGRLKQGFLAADIADFAAFDPSFSPTYISAFVAAIDAAEAFPDDETIVDIMTGFTIVRDTKWAECKKAYQKMKFFIEKAFPINIAVQNEFGFNDYYESSKTVEKMIRFMYKLYQTAMKYSVQLTQANVTATDIAALLTLHDELKEADYKQEEYKNERQKLTQRRGELVEDLYKNYISYICKAGKIIYADNPAQYARYLLPARSTSTAPRVESLGAQERSVINAETKTGEYYTLEVIDGVSLSFYIAPNGSTAVPANAVSITPTTQNLTYAVIDLGFDANFGGKQTLFAYNPNNDTVTYKAELME